MPSEILWRRRVALRLSMSFDDDCVLFYGIENTLF